MGVYGPFSVVFDQSIDPAAVSRDYFVLVSELGEAPKVSLTHDAGSHTVTITPTVPLRYAHTYELRVGSVPSADGRLGSSAIIQFRTDLTVVGRELYFDNSGGVSRYTTMAYTAMGVRRAMADYRDPGPDGMWLTDDDVATRAWSFGVRDTDDEVENTYAEDPGADDVFGTSDDVIQSRTVVSMGRYRDRETIVYYGPGPDGTWRTSDDVVSLHSTRLWSEELPVHLLRHDQRQAGPDGSMGTADDVVGGTSYEYGEDGRMRSARTYNAGELTALTRYEWPDALVRRTIRYAAGPDGVFETADDPIAGYTEERFDERGLLIAATTVVGAAADGAWFTADDDVTHRVVHDYDLRGVRFTHSSFDGPGPDGTWGTSDDQMSWCVEYVRDLEGRPIAAERYTDPGPDGIWRTSDDVRSSRTEFARL